MGMFDYVNIELSMLPISEEEREDIGEENGDFQTKSLDRTLDHYDIAPALDPSGCQLFRTSHYDVPVEFRVECEPVRLTGILNFYTSGDSDEWYEFYAKFENGKLLEITRNR